MKRLRKGRVNVTARRSVNLSSCQLCAGPYLDCWLPHAGYYAVLPYAIAQGTVELPYILVQSVIYSAIVYSMVGFQWTAAKCDPKPCRSPMPAPVMSRALWQIIVRTSRVCAH